MYCKTSSSPYQDKHDVNLTEGKTFQNDAWLGFQTSWGFGPQLHKIQF